MIFAPFAVAKIGAIAERHPGLRVIVDHMGLNVQWKGKDLGPRHRCLGQIRAHEKCRSQSVPAYPAMSRSPIRFQHCIRRSVALSSAFGPQRIFWGTDLSQMPCSYRQAVTLFTEELRFSFRAGQRVDYGPSSRELAALAAG